MAQKPKQQQPSPAQQPQLSARDRQLILSGLGKLKASYERAMAAAVKENNIINKQVYAQTLAEIRAIEVIL